MKIGIIRNPVAGGFLSRRRWRAIEPALRARFPSMELHETRGVGDGMRLADELCSAGYDLIIAAGGDGTVSEVATGILASARPQTPLSFIPLGTGSDFSRNFSLPRAPEALAAHIAGAEPRPIDVGILLSASGAPSGRVFVNIASIGISGNIVRAANSGGFTRLAGGKAHFMFHSTREILRYRPRSVRVLVDGAEVFRGPVVSVVCANGSWFGGGMHVMPMSDVRDGMLDIGILRFASRLGVLKLMLQLYSGSHLADPLVSIHRGRRVEVMAEGSIPAIAEADGEEVGEGALGAEIRHQALWLRM